MASITHENTSTGFGAKVSKFFAAVSAGMVAYMERRARFEQINALQAKSDEELAQMGVKREEIASHVFRDLFYV